MINWELKQLAIDMASIIYWIGVFHLIETINSKHGVALFAVISCYIYIHVRAIMK